MTAFSVVFLAASLGFLGLFFWGYVRVAGRILQGSRDPLRQPVAQQLRSLWSLVLLHRRFFSEPSAAAMHLGFFFGFLLLLPQDVNLIGRVFSPAFSLFAFSPALDRLYLPIKEAAGAAVILACGFALLRRWFFRPARLKSTFEASAVVALISLIVFADLFADACRTLAPAEQRGFMAWSWLSIELGALLKSAGLKPEEPLLAVAALNNLAALSIFAFLAWLPSSKHFHIVLGIPRAMRARTGTVRPLAVRPVSEESGPVPDDSFAAFSQGELYDLATCTECGRCANSCPSWNAGTPLNPRDLAAGQRRAMMARTSPVAAAGAEAVWSCTTCGACEAACPLGIEHVGRVIRMRQHLTMAKSALPASAANAIAGLRDKGNPWGLARAKRADWLTEASVPLFANGAKSTRLVFLGCMYSFDATLKQTAINILSLLTTSGVDFACLGFEEGCCGDSARRLGDELLFSQLAAANIATFKRYGVEEIVLLCPHGYNLMRNEYQALGLTAKVRFITELLAELPASPVSAAQPQPRVFLHDPCYLSRYNGIEGLSRNLLKQRGLRVLDSAHTGKDSLCCGAGGGMYFADENKAGAMAAQRYLEFVEAGADVVLTTCPYCRTMLQQAAGQRRFAAVKRPEVRDLIDWLSER